jgi:nucleoside-diphosphate-sugar epimerase
MRAMAGTLLSLGHGYSASALARLLLPQGWQVTGTTRQPDRLDAVAAGGARAVLWPGTDLGPHLAGRTC